MHLVGYASAVTGAQPLIKCGGCHTEVPWGIFRLRPGSRCGAAHLAVLSLSYVVLLVGSEMMRFFAACMIALLCSRPLLVDWSYRACVKIVAPRPSSMPLPQQAGARLVRLVQGTVGMQAQRSVQRTWLRSQLPHPASGVGCCGRALYLNSRGILARCVHGCGTGLGAVLKRHASWEANRRTGMLFWIGHRANMGLVRAKLLQDRHRHSQLACLLALLLGC
jgi:hypothetical protein